MDLVTVMPGPSGLRFRGAGLVLNLTARNLVDLREWLMRWRDPESRQPLSALVLSGPVAWEAAERLEGLSLRRLPAPPRPRVAVAAFATAEQNRSVFPGQAVYRKGIAELIGRGSVATIALGEASYRTRHIRVPFTLESRRRTAFAAGEVVVDDSGVIYDGRLGHPTWAILSMTVPDRASLLFHVDHRHLVIIAKRLRRYMRNRPDTGRGSETRRG